ncbi:MAG: ABZJ_00895 family protein [Kiloniellales bacterium]|nr:ABZJ_00895 family protein [Kiloniellales bacterium]
MDDGTVSTKRYVLIFAAVYGVLALTIALFAELTGIEPNSGVSSGMFVAAVILPAHRFAKDHDRLPSMRERLMFAFGCLVVSAGASLAFFGAGRHPTAQTL